MEFTVEQRLLRLPRVREKTGLSRTAVYSNPSFPKPVKIGERAVAWLESEVDDWIAQRIVRSRGCAFDAGEGRV
ncbi:MULTISPECIES: AlpA family transcriptional regulator [unclassified Caballeronia]|uniref:helix-turn-helix transcriptional regulator n=1 Tax=unclassified Caballeronia TaxID=2646786 RepID=UPI00285FA8FB|nr:MULTISPECIES: AlpA family transcriptional regulator [unclassified Caballeronia]MDR5776600.1 AlpA family transcriptional regulator [Caballeronia sp. LZ002]MDR5800579.1 AlpA family transcriptional regulator [Caballeronia sp. LZ001]MDR5802520.1 AlpA family transcriptional regulator [Caballeronia sp. LZ001]MDR5852053.1 AlpA family transcriptional regulator [Caballeronia sp. LZ003]